MSGFSSLDDINLETVTNGKSDTAFWVRTINTGATSAAGMWHDTFSGGGTGGTGVITGTAATGVALDSSTLGSLPISYPVTFPDERYALRFYAQTAAATATPGVIVLTDLLYIYPSCQVNAGTTLFVNTAPKPTRLGTGEGVEVSAIVSTVHGTNSPILQINYDNSAGVNNFSLLSAPAASSPVGRLYAAGGTANVLSSPYMPLNQTEGGVRQLTQYSVSANGTTGTVTFVLHRPVLEIPLVAANVPSLENYIGEFMPKVDDDACLAMFVLVGGALPTGQTITTSLRHGWG